MIETIAEPVGVIRREVPGEARAALGRAFAELPSAEADSEALLARVLQTAHHLPVDILRTLLWFRVAPQAPRALLLAGMPLDEHLPPTPTDPAARVVKSGQVSQCGILLVAVLLGEPVAYAGEKGGALVQDVFPTEGQRTTPSNESSAVPLEFHTELTFSRAAPEQSFDVAAPDYVLLLALRSAVERSATTSIVEARDLCDRLQPRALKTLREERFQLRAPHSFTRDNGDRPWSRPLALVRGPVEDPRIAFDIACGVRALTPAAEEALDALRTACAEPAVQRAVRLGEGDLLVIDNERCAHSRSPYVAAFDGRDRWVHRTYVRRSLRGLRLAATDSIRVLA